MTVDSLYAEGGSGDLLGYAWKGMFVASRIVDLAVEGERVDDSGVRSGTSGKEIEWKEVVKPKVASGASRFNVLCSWLSLAKEKATLVTHGIYEPGTASEPGHQTMVHEVHGQTSTFIGPPAMH